MLEEVDYKLNLGVMCLCMEGWCLFKCLCTLYIPDAIHSQKRAVAPLGLELLMAGAAIWML